MSGVLKTPVDKLVQAIETQCRIEDAINLNLGKPMKFPPLKEKMTLKEKCIFMYHFITVFHLRVMLSKHGKEAWVSIMLHTSYFSSVVIIPLLLHKLLATTSTLFLKQHHLQKVLMLLDTRIFLLTALIYLIVKGVRSSIFVKTNTDLNMWKEARREINTLVDSFLLELPAMSLCNYKIGPLVQNKLKKHCSATDLELMLLLAENSPLNIKELLQLSENTI